jgi:hypothetical protein
MSDTVDVETLRIYLRDTETQIEELQSEKADLLKRIAALMLPSTDATQTVDERFKLWLEYGVKKDYPWIQNIESKAGVDLLEYEIFIYWSRNQTITIDRVSEKIREMLEVLASSDPDIGFSKYSLSEKMKRHDVTIETIHEWMEELMRLNFGSCIMDW